MRVSVIVPHYCDKERLELCLQSLRDQSYGASNIQIIVIDDGSPQGTFGSDGLGSDVELLTQENNGSYKARNLGVRHADGEVLAFTDSDCIPDVNWIKEGVRSLENAGGVVAGSVHVFAACESRPTAVECYEILTAFNQQQYVQVDNFGVTANLLVKKSTFESVGFFDSTLRSGGDREWGRRASKQGNGIHYAPAASVAHPARRSLGQICVKIHRVAEGVADMRAKGESIPDASLWLTLRRILIPPIGLVKNILVNAKVPGIWRKLRTCLVAWYVASYRSYWSYVYMARLRSSQEEL